MLNDKSERDNIEDILTALDLHVVLERDVSQLSGGELQRFAIGMSCVQKADMYVTLFCRERYWVTDDL